MENTILARDINPVINGYKERNIYIKRFLSDLVLRSLNKAVKKEEAKNILNFVPNDVLYTYKNAAAAAVENKYKEITKTVQALANRPVILTLETAVPALISLDIEKFKKFYSEDINKSEYLLSTAVTKEQTDTISEIAIKLVDLVKNNIKPLLKEYIAEVKSNVNVVNESELEIDSYFIDKPSIVDNILVQGVVRKFFSNNFSYNTEETLSLKDMVKILESFNPNDINVDKIDMELTDYAKEFVGELGDDVIENFINKIETSNDDYITLSTAIKNLSVIRNNVYDLTFLTFVWVVLADYYNRNNDKNVLHSLLKLEKIIKLVNEKYDSYEERKLVAILDKKPSPLIILYNPMFSKALDINKDAFAILGGYLVNNTSDRMYVDIEEFKRLSESADKYITYYNRHIASIRYKNLIMNTSNMRDAYIYALYKFEDKLIKVEDNSVLDLRGKLIKQIELFLANKKPDELLNVEDLSIQIFRDFIYPNIFDTILGFVELANSRFEDEDNAEIFVLLLTITEVVFSMLKVLVVDEEY